MWPRASGGKYVRYTQLPISQKRIRQRGFLFRKYLNANQQAASAYSNLNEAN